jgi:hypothetical protein
MVVPGHTTKQQMSGTFISSQAPNQTSIGRISSIAAAL